MPDAAMRLVSADTVRERVTKLILTVSRGLPPYVLEALAAARANERSPRGREILRQLLDNAAYAAATGLPVCQDTGSAVFFVKHGEDVRLEGGTLRETLTRATADAYRTGHLRNSMCHPLTRANTGDNTPIVLHVDLAPGDELTIRFLPKGGGAENMSRCAMFPPSRGREGIKDFVRRVVAEAGPNPCPPVIVGVGVGGTFDLAPALAKEALLRPLGTPNPDPEAALLERELLPELNRLCIGPGGMGGDATCLAVHVRLHPCHIASLPVAVNIQCNAARYGEVHF